jgi:hypothetical protein
MTTAGEGVVWDSVDSLWTRLHQKDYHAPLQSVSTQILYTKTTDQFCFPQGKDAEVNGHMPHWGSNEEIITAMYLLWHFRVFSLGDLISLSVDRFQV